MFEDEGFEEATERFKEATARLRQMLDTMADETVLDDEKLALKRFLEASLEEAEVLRFYAEFGENAVVLESLRAAMAKAADLAPTPALARRAQEAIQEFEAIQAEPKWRIKETAPTPEIRRVLTRTRSLATQCTNDLGMFSLVKQKVRAAKNREFLLKIEHRENYIRAHLDEALENERSLVFELERRGEKVPVWKNRPEVPETP